MALLAALAKVRDAPFLLDAIRAADALTVGGRSGRRPARGQGADPGRDDRRAAMTTR